MPQSSATSAIVAPARPLRAKTRMPASTISSTRDGRWAGRRSGPAFIGPPSAAIWSLPTIQVPPATGGSPAISEPTTARRPAHRPSRRDDVLVAGTVEFVERGFASVSVTDIAKRAGMTPAAVYYHFPTKEDVLLALVGRTGDAITGLCGE